MKKLVLLYLLVSLLSVRLKAQELPTAPVSRSTFSIGIGINQLSGQDQNASPLTYAGKLPQVSIQYKRLFTNGELHIGLQGRYGSFNSKAYPDRAINYDEIVVPLENKLAAATFFVNYLQKVHQSQHGPIQVGTGIQQLIQYPIEAPYAGLVAITSLPLILQAKHQFNSKNSIQSQVRYSLAGLVTRFPWHATISLPEVTSNLKALYLNNTHLEGGHRLNQFAWQTNFQHQVSKHTNVGLTYELERLRHPDPRRLSSWSNSLSVTSAFKF